jgi:putative MATE family efflux protein
MPSSQTDLTSGDVRRQLIIYATPIIITSLIQSLYALVDMVVVSRFIGSAGASAVNNAGQVTRMVTQIIIGLTSGGGVLVGQYFGHGDKESRMRAIGTFFSLFAALGVLIILVLAVFSRPILIALRAPALEESYSYLFICSCGMIFVTGYNVIASVLRAVGNSKTPLQCIIAASVTNVVLDLLMVGYYSMGTAGAAIATVISQAVSFVAGLIYLLRHKEIFSFAPADFKIDRPISTRIFTIGFPAAVQMTVASISWLTVTFLINDYGVVYSAASGIAFKIRDISHLFISSLGIGATAMIAQNIGAREFDRAKKVMYTAMKMAALVAVVQIVIIELFAPALSSLFIDDPAVIAAAARNLRIEIISELFYAVILIYHSLMMGSGQSYMALTSSFVNCILFRLIFAIWFNSLWGVDGVFIACAIAPASSIPVGLLFTRSRLWRRSLAVQ